MKKGILIFLALTVAISGMMAACSSKDDSSNSSTKSTTKDDGLAENDDVYVMVTTEVTDKNGKTVTNKKGKAVTTAVNYQKVTDKNGNTYYRLIDDNGDPAKDSKGNEITRKTLPTTTTTTKKTTTKKGGKSSTTEDNLTSTTKKSTTAVTGGEKTNPTTEKTKNDKVPKTSDTGKAAAFSATDQETLKSMLEVPYLYNANYENSDGIPINIAAHAAVWMAKREYANTTKYASGTIVLDLFNYFGQTVVNFKTECNSKKDKNCPIKYSKSNDTFTISKFEDAQQKIQITDIQTLGNNYYKVVATVSGAGSISKVNAVFQKNKLDSSLGFSLKAVKWS